MIHRFSNMFCNMVVLLVLLNSVRKSEEFFLNSRDFRRIFRFLPSFTDTYRNEASDVNYDTDDYQRDGEQQQEQADPNLDQNVYYQPESQQQPQTVAPPAQNYEIIYNNANSNRNDQYKLPYYAPKNSAEHNCAKDPALHVTPRPDSSELQLKTRIPRRKTVENPIFKERINLPKNYFTGILVAVPRGNSGDFEKMFYVNSEDVKNYLRPSKDVDKPAGLSDEIVNFFKRLQISE